MRNWMVIVFCAVTGVPAQTAAAEEHFGSVRYRIPEGWQRVSDTGRSPVIRSLDQQAVIALAPGTPLRRDCRSSLEEFVRATTPAGSHLDAGSGPTSSMRSRHGLEAANRPVRMVSNTQGDSYSWFWAGCTSNRAEFLVFLTKDTQAWEEHKHGLAEFLEHWNYSGGATPDGLHLDLPRSGLEQALIGTWSMRDNVISNAYFMSYEFRADGTYRHSVINMGLMTGYSGFVGNVWSEGTYTLQGNRVILRWRQQKSDPVHVKREQLKTLTVRGTEVIEARVEGGQLLISNPPGTWPTKYTRTGAAP